MRKICIVALLTFVPVGVGWLMKPDTAPGPAHGFYPANLRLPELESEQSPYFYRQKLFQGDGSSVEVLRFRRDESEAHLVCDKSGKLSSVRVYRQSAAGKLLTYEANYGACGRRIVSAKFYALDGSIESCEKRNADGSVSYEFFRAGQLIQTQELDLHGALTTVNYEDGIESSRSKLAAPLENRDIAFWDEAKGKIRLRVQLSGARLKSFEYFDKEGKLEHTGRVLVDGSLEFVYNEDGKLQRRQVWRLVGEDWERAYYGLAYSELYAADGKTVEHKVWMRSNGSLFRHERFNGKNGKLEMEREFDLEGRVACVEEFKETGERKQRWDFPASSPRSRGFVPNGMRSYPGGDEKTGYVYNLDGKPFQHSVFDRQPWSIFRN